MGSSLKRKDKMVANSARFIISYGARLSDVALTRGGYVLPTGGACPVHSNGIGGFWGQQGKGCVRKSKGIAQHTSYVHLKETLWR